MRLQYCPRNGTAGNERLQIRRGLLGDGAQFPGELHLAPPFARRVKDGPALHGAREHLFEAKRLGAKLNVVVVEVPPLALLVFDRHERAAGMLLDDVALPAEPELLGPDGERAKQRDAFGDFVAGPSACSCARSPTTVWTFARRNPSTIFNAARRLQKRKSLRRLSGSGSTGA
ncbi:MAG: hypothetical protein M3463_18850 [Verrucomicrobiota bacterium]|nr:hypothetical protein [Verrucomicrobiota bacterium]